MGKERQAPYYDIHYRKTGVAISSPMIPIIAYIADVLRERKVKSVLDIGCGAGAMLAECEKANIISYGFDFSPEAIKLCKESRKLKNTWIGDARHSDNFVKEYDAYLCLEVLEHIKDDIGVIKNLRSGVLFIFSVPTFIGQSSHVRRFKTDGQIRVRYDKFVNIENIKLFWERRVTIGRIK